MRMHHRLCYTTAVSCKGGIEGPAGPANAVPLSEAVCSAGVIADLFRRAKVPEEQIR